MLKSFSYRSRVSIKAYQSKFEARTKIMETVKQIMSNVDAHIAKLIESIDEGDFPKSEGQFSTSDALCVCRCYSTVERRNFVKVVSGSITE